MPSESNTRVAHIIPAFTQGGAEEMLLKIVQSSPGHGVDHVVIALSDRGTMRTRFERHCATYSLGIKGSLPGFGSAFELVRLVRQSKPHLIQGWMYHGNLAATWAWALYRARVPLCWTIRQSLYDIRNEKALSKVVIYLNAWLSRLPKAIIFNSYCSLEQHARFGLDARKTIMIPNGFDLNRFTPDEFARSKIRQALGIDAQAPLVGMIARLHPMKDHTNFFKAAELILESIPKAHFLLAGTNVTREYLPLPNELANAAHQFHLLGERKDTTDLMNAMDVLTVASRWGEAFPNVIGEALACGTPCVATDVGDSKRILGDCGKTVPAGNPELLASAVIATLNESGEKKAFDALLRRQRVRDYFDILKITANYNSTYAALVKGLPLKTANTT